MSFKSRLRSCRSKLRPLLRLTNLLSKIRRIRGLPCLSSNLINQSPSVLRQAKERFSRLRARSRSRNKLSSRFLHPLESECINQKHLKATMNKTWMGMQSRLLPLGATIYRFRILKGSRVSTLKIFWQVKSLSLKIHSNCKFPKWAWLLRPSPQPPTEVSLLTMIISRATIFIKLSCKTPKWRQSEVLSRKSKEWRRR